MPEGSQHSRTSEQSTHVRTVYATAPVVCCRRMRCLGWGSLGGER